MDSHYEENIQVFYYLWYLNSSALHVAAWRYVPLPSLCNLLLQHTAKDVVLFYKKKNVQKEKERTPKKQEPMQFSLLGFFCLETCLIAQFELVSPSALSIHHQV